MPKIAMSSCAMEESSCVEALKFAAENGFDLIKNFPHIITLEVVAPGPDTGPILKSLEYFRKLEKTMGSSQLHLS